VLAPVAGVLVAGMPAHAHAFPAVADVVGEVAERTARRGVVEHGAPPSIARTSADRTAMIPIRAKPHFLLKAIVLGAAILAFGGGAVAALVLHALGAIGP